MPKIKLAYWVGDHKPGDEVEVTDTELAALTRDGRVAEVVQDSPDQVPSVQPETVAPAESGEEPARKRR